MSVCRSSLQLRAENEVHRLYSLGHLPETCRVRPTVLAHSGFHCPDSDTARVICYQCGLSISVDTLRNAIDLILQHQKLSPSCPVANGKGNPESVPRQPQQSLEILERYSERSPHGSVGEKLSLSRRPAHDAMDSAPETDQDNSPAFVAGVRAMMKRASRNGIMQSLKENEHVNYFTGTTRVIIDLTNPNYDQLRREVVRLGTFREFPKSAPVRPADLARNGFFYIGPGDRVSCVFCRNPLRSWAPNDIVEKEHEKHFGDCPFVLGLSVGNVPLADDVECEVRVVENGNSLRGSGGADGAYRQTARIISALTSDALTPSAAVPVSTPAATVGETTQPRQTLANLTFDPSNPPKHPEYIEPESRRRTFQLTGVTVPVGQEVNVLVDAGFYHVGPHDNVKCFYCDVGLKNFQPNDDPWMEHAKWFPRCTYVRQRKGAEYIQRAQSLRDEVLRDQGPRRQTANFSNNNLTSLTSLNASNVTPSVDLIARSSAHATDGTRAPSGDNNTAAPPSGSASGSSVATVAAAPSSGPLPSGVSATPSSGPLPSGVSAAPSSGPTTAPSAATQPKSTARRNKKKKKESLSQTVDKTSAKNIETSEPTVEFRADDAAAAADDPEADELLEENRQLRDARTCKVCMDRDVNVVFLPCGHLVSCDACAPELRNCAVCRTLIRGTVKIFLS